MRIAPVVAALIASFALTSAGCSADIPPDPGGVRGGPSAARPWPAELNLPVSGVAGDLPPPGETVVITCTAAGDVRVGDVLVERPADLVARIAERVDRDDGGASPTSVLLAFDGSVPWRAVARAMQACADPKVSAPRVFFAVRHAGDREPGAFAAFLPVDRCVPSPELREAEQRTLGVTVQVTAAAEAREPVAVGYWLLGLIGGPPAPNRVMITLEPDPDAPLATVIAAADSARRGGAAGLSFAGARGPADGDVRGIAPNVTSGPARRFGVRLPGHGPSADPGALPIPPRVRGLAGFPESAATGEFELKPEEEPPPPIEDDTR